MGGGRNRKSSRKNNDESILTEARKFKQQAERKSDGPERIPLFEKCTHLFDQALKSQLPPQQREEALFDLGEVFLLWSSAIKKASNLSKCSAVRGNIQKNHAIHMQHEASIHAASLCRQSVEAYKMICALEGAELKQESMMNCASALCDWGDLVSEIPTDKGGGVSLAAGLYAEADSLYSEALACDPEDVELLTNLGDCCIKRAELAFELNSTQTYGSQSSTSASRFYERAFIAYENACSRADVKCGDDLAGLLQNWGAGLLSLAEHTLDIAEAAKAFKFSEEKMRNAASFSRADTSLHIALGELFSMQADRCSQHKDYQSQVPSLLENAINEGYGVALQIDATNLDALIGYGEVCYTLSKHFLHLGHTERAKQYSMESLQRYMKVVNLLEQDSVGKYEPSFEEQCDIIYNMACAAGICGEEDVCFRYFKHLIQIEAICPSELAEDLDLQSLRNKEWFVSLTNQNP